MNFSSNNISSATGKRDLKPCSRIVNTRMSMIQLVEKFKEIFFSY